MMQIMPFQSSVKVKTKISSNESETEFDNVILENEITTIHCQHNEKKKTVYWVTHNEPTFNEDVMDRVGGQTCFCSRSHLVTKNEVV